MALVKNGRIVADDWTRLGDSEPLPNDDRPVLISFARWFAERDALAGRNAPLGLIVANTDRVEDLDGAVDRFDVIALDFPKFTDGRAYSQARILRDRLKFTGELRATGQVLRDQLLFLKRVGFDTFETAREIDEAAFAAATGAFSAVYQPAADGQISILRQRLLRKAAS